MKILAVLLVSQVIGAWAACSRRGVECIDYQILGRHQGYEERQYPASTWVSTSMEGPSLTQANREMYHKLFAYRQGNNAKGMKINATTPIRTRIVPCHGATCASLFVMSFLIPSELTDPPYPLDTDVFVENTLPARYAVSVFDGRPNEIDWLEESHKLAALVKKDPNIDRSHYFTVWYDPPYQLFHRTNEIWMARKIVKDTPTTLDREVEMKEHKTDEIKKS